MKKKNIEIYFVVLARCHLQQDSKNDKYLLYLYIYFLLHQFPLLSFNFLTFSHNIVKLQVYLYEFIKSSCVRNNFNAKFLPYVLLI